MAPFVHNNLDQKDKISRVKRLDQLRLSELSWHCRKTCFYDHSPSLKGLKRDMLKLYIRKNSHIWQEYPELYFSLLMIISKISKTLRIKIIEEIIDLMVAYLNDARCRLQLKRNERLYEFAGWESLFNPCTRLGVQLHPVLDPEVGSSLDDEYTVTQFPPGYYFYVKWWDGGLILQASTKVRNKSESREWYQKAKILCFCLSSYFGTLDSTLFHIFEGLSIFCQRGLKIQAVLGLIPCCG